MNRLRPRKRSLIAGLVGLSLFAGVWAFAASLTVNTKTLGAGTSVVASCNPSAAISYGGASYVSGLPGYEVTTASVTSALACANMPYKITLYGAANASLGEATGTLDASGNATPDFTAANISAALVTGVAVVVTG